jgi:GT2 family glycosyltransferase
MPSPEISICILAGHGLESLNACLESLDAQVSAPSFELLIGGNPTPERMSVIHRHFPAAQVCNTGGRLPGAARNPLIERARGELLLFLDDDVIASPDLLRRLAQAAARYPQASVFGGPNETPPHSSRFQVVQGAVLSSLVGAGPVSRRYGARHPGPADERWFTLCNLAIRKRVMPSFSSEFVCAEENALLSELRTRGEEMRYDPGLSVFHTRRSKAGPFAEQMFKYGRGRGQLLARRPVSTFRAAYVAPTALLFYLILLPATLALSVAPMVAIVPAMVYCGLVIANALRIGGTLKRPAAVPLAAALIVTIHLCYGAGVVRGLLSPRKTREELCPSSTSAPGEASDRANASEEKPVAVG